MAPSTSQSNNTLTTLQTRWTHLYREHLPTLARQHHTKATASAATPPSSQPHLHSPWPVTLDHCFARIILDNVIGSQQGKPWTDMLKAPAVKNMSVAQLRAAVEMAERIAEGKEDLWALDEESLRLRGKQTKAGGTKRKRNGEGDAKADGAKVAKVEDKMRRTDQAKTASEVKREGESAFNIVKNEDSTSHARPGAGIDNVEEQAKQDSPADSGVGLEEKPMTTASEQEQQAEEISPIEPEAPLRSPTESKSPPTKKTRKAHMADIWSSFYPIPPPSESPPNASSTSTSTAKCKSKLNPTETTNQNETQSLDRARQILAKDASMSPYRKHILTLLTQVPKGRWTTYQLLADAAVRIPNPAAAGDTSSPNTSQSQQRGSARAAGSAMRHNPLAPTVPCHRVLATGGKLGGFGGEWGDEGRFAKEKRRLLREEGVKFCGDGRVAGGAWGGFGVY